MNTVNIVAVILFLVMWGLAMWKGNAFLRMPLKWRMLISTAISGGMLAWILALHNCQ